MERLQTLKFRNTALLNRPLEEHSFSLNPEAGRTPTPQEKMALVWDEHLARPSYYVQEV